MLPKFLATCALALALATPTLAAAQQPAQETTPALDEIVVTLRVSPADAQVWVDGVARGAGTLELQLDPGAHEIRVQKPGYQTRIETLVLTEASARDIMMSVNLSRVDPDVMVVGRSGGIIDSMERSRKAAGWISVISGAALIGTSVYFAARSGVPDSCSTLNPEPCDGANNYAPWASFTGAVGGVALLGGLGLLTWDSLAGEHPEPSGDKKEKTARVFVTPGGASFKFTF